MTFKMYDCLSAFKTFYLSKLISGYGFYYVFLKVLEFFT